jgi:serine/threonine protein kinase
MIYLKHFRILHRDIAARNVLLDENLSNAKLGDFGYFLRFANCVYNFYQISSHDLRIGGEKLNGRDRDSFEEKSPCKMDGARMLRERTVLVQLGNVELWNCSLGNVELRQSSLQKG